MATQQDNRSVMIGVFEDLRLAQEAVSELKSAGFSDHQIGVITRTEETEADLGSDTQEDAASKAAEGAVTGLAAGASVGALWAIGIAAGMLPAVGPVIAGGLLASVLASAAGGAAVAGLVGALIGLGIPEEEAAYYEGELRSGRTIVTVQSTGRHDEITTIFERYGAYDMRGRVVRRQAEFSGTPRGTVPPSHSGTGAGPMGAGAPLPATGATATESFAGESPLPEGDTDREGSEDLTRKYPR